MHSISFTKTSNIYYDSILVDFPQKFYTFLLENTLEVVTFYFPFDMPNIVDILNSVETSIHTYIYDV